MSCEYGQTRCEDKNMEADRNKCGLGERREAERRRERQRATGVPKCCRDCAGMVARGLSAEWAPLPLPSPSEELHAGAQMPGSVFDTQIHTNAQADTGVASSPAFARHCVCVQLRVPVSVCMCAL